MIVSFRPSPETNGCPDSLEHVQHIRHLDDIHVCHKVSPIMAIVDDLRNVFHQSRLRLPHLIACIEIVVQLSWRKQTALCELFNCSKHQLRVG